MKELKDLIIQLLVGDISGIEYGDPECPTGFLSHHRIDLTDTPAGKQISVRTVMHGMTGSGAYFGDNVNAVMEYSQKLVEKYNQPHPNPKIQEFLKNKRRAELSYFAIL